MSYYEVFNNHLSNIRVDQINNHSHDTWRSNHPVGAPYFLEFQPLIKDTGGVEKFCAGTSFDHFIPPGGLHGQLGESEHTYLASLIAHARSLDKIPVLSCTRTLGRLRAIKAAFPGLHILVCRRLFQQWCSYTAQCVLGNSYFMNTVREILDQNKHDPVIAWIGGNFPLGAPEIDNANYFLCFSLLHLYLYAQVADAADLVVDVNRLVADSDYRQATEAAIAAAGGIAVDLSDARDSMEFSLVSLGSGSDLAARLGPAAERIIADAPSPRGRDLASRALADLIEDYGRYTEFPGAAAKSGGSPGGRDAPTAPDPLGRAMAALHAKDFAACIAACESALAADPRSARALHLAGSAWCWSGKPQAGIKLLVGAFLLAPGEVAFRVDLATVLAAHGRREEAIRLLRDGFGRHPAEPRVTVRLARLLSDSGRHDEAIAILSAAVAKLPLRAEYHRLLAAEYAGELRLSEALLHLRLAEASAPDVAEIQTGLGVLHQALGDPDAAIGHHERAVALGGDDPAPHFNLATALLTRGDFARGFAEFEWRLRMLPRACPAPPGWRGERLDGRRLLVTAEQGFGDMIQFARFLPRLAAFGGEVVVESPPELERLFASLPGVSGCTAAGKPTGAFDVGVPLLSLPAVLGCTKDDLAAPVPYVRPPAGVRVELPEGDGLRVGLVWAGRPATGEVYVRRSLNRRSCRLASLAPLADVPGVTLYSLQTGEPAAQLAASGLPIHDIGSRLGDFADTAAAIAALDLVISVDTAAVHLAGAMGRPVWVMLAPGQADYRWGTSGETSPWYPTARLFRADSADWSGMVAAVAAALREVRPT